jgi:hypothetical protein
VCRDRLTPTSRLVDWLELNGYEQVVLVDNDSSYPPLVQYLSQSPHHVVRLRENLGPHRAVWTTGVRERFASSQHYVVTDCDVVPDDTCPGDVIEYFLWVLRRYPTYAKVGLGLRIDNIPDTYALRSKVCDWEGRFWLRALARDLYDAIVDTTFALYRPDAPFTLGPAIRTGGSYVALHLPWYGDSANPTDEQLYYSAHCRADVNHWDDSAGPGRWLDPRRLSALERLRWRWTAFSTTRDRSVPRRFAHAEQA